MTIQEQRTMVALEKYCSKASHQLSEIDWEQRRYEIAKEIYVRAAANVWDGELVQSIAERAIKNADILIKQLQEKPV